MNEFKEPIEKKEEPVQEPKPKKKDKLTELTEEVLPFDEDWFKANFSYMMLVFLLLLGYIFNSHYHQKLVRKINASNREIKELRAEYITIKSDLEFNSKQSQIVDRLKERGLKELSVPPFKIKKED